MTHENKFIVGIDPGLSGGIAFLRPNGLLSVLGMPTTKIKLNGKNKTIIDLERLSHRFDRSDIQLAMIEQAQMRGTEARQSTARTFEGFGILKGVIAANFHRFDTVPAATWKKAMGCTKDKDQTRARATELMPGAAKFWQRANQDGWAEAALIALYTAELLGIELPPVRAAI